MSLSVYRLARCDFDVSLDYSDGDVYMMVCMTFMSAFVNGYGVQEPDWIWDWDWEWNWDPPRQMGLGMGMVTVNRLRIRSWIGRKENDTPGLKI